MNSEEEGREGAGRMTSRSLAGVCVCVCVSLVPFSPLERERL